MGENQSNLQEVAHSQNQNEAEEDQLIDSVTAAGGTLLPELKYEILCRLPAKSVGRFRCVSKDWKILLSDPKFLKNQFILNNHRTKYVVNPKFGLYTLLSIGIRNDCNNIHNPIAFCKALNVNATYRKYNLCGSCNGLILLDDCETSLLSIVNPITHESRQLPSIPQSIVGGFNMFGFGYCENDDEYTVVIVSDYRHSSPVYMLKRDLWKRVEDSPLGLRFCGVFVAGSIHWFGYRNSDSFNVVCAFDLASERFSEVEVPEGLRNDVYGFLVDILGGCLCLVHPRSSSTTDIWVMKKYGLRESWTKYVAYSTSANYVDPLCFWNSDESIVAMNEGEFVLCCLKQRTSAIIPVIGEQIPAVLYGRKWNFVASLFSPNSSN